MKKRAGIIILCLMLTLTAFTLSACGGLSGVEVDQETFNKAKANCKEAFANGPVTLEYSSEYSKTERYENLTKYSGPYYISVAEKTSYLKTNAENTSFRIVYDRDAIYVKESTDKEEKSSEGSTSSSSLSGESYFVKANGYIYLLTKGADGGWYALMKTSMSGTMAEYAYSVFSRYAFLSDIENFLWAVTSEFDCYEYSGGRYNLKKDVFNGINLYKYIDSSSTYTYGDDDFFYKVFNGNRLYGGYEYSQSVTEKYEYTQDWSGMQSTTEKLTETVSKSQAKLTYSGKVNVPAYTDLTG